MADPKGSKDKAVEGASRQPSFILFIIVALILTLAAAAGGGVLGMMLADMVQAPEPTKTEEAKKPASEGSEKSAQGEGGHDEPKEEAEAASEEEPVHLVLKPLSPIIANLAAPAGTWIRIEASIVLDEETAKEGDILAAKTSEDILGFLRTVSLAQIEGASGYLHLREDLSDLVKFRSEGRVRDFIMQSMVVE
jgi:flagellar FliL protein